MRNSVSVILNQFAPKILPGQLITLVDVEVTADMGIAKVYLGFMNSEDKERSLEVVEQYAKEIRRTFAAGAGRHMRKVPEFWYFLDTTMDHAERINKLLDDLNSDS